MEDYIIILLGLPIAFFLGALGFQLVNLFWCWLKFKFDNLKELRIWD